jgi:hypothetical protein
MNTYSGIRGICINLRNMENRLMGMACGESSGGVGDVSSLVLPNLYSQLVQQTVNRET